MTVNLSPKATEQLLTAGVDLDLLTALVDGDRLRRVNDHAFEIPCVAADGSESAWYVAIDAHDARPWQFTNPQPAVWWPIENSDASTAIVVVGAEAGLALASLLFHVAEDGQIRRRPNLPGVLASAAPVVLPEEHPDTPVEWLAGKLAPDELVALLAAAGCDLAFLAIVVERLPTELMDTARQFAFHVAEAGSAVGMTAAPVLLPCGLRLTDLAVTYQGHGARYALVGILDFWHEIVLRPPQTLDVEST